MSEDKNKSERVEKLKTRYEQIVAYVARHGEAQVAQLAQHFAVSAMTIRRDLAALEAQGRLTRTHGGAVLARETTVEFAFSEKERRYAAEKRAIAREVMNLLKPGMSISLDSGTTTLEVARLLSEVSGVTVLTSSLAIASVLYTQESIQLVLLGGTVRKGSPDLTGWLTEANLEQFHVDLAIVGADGVTRQGAYTRAVDQTRVCKALMAGAEKTVLAVDHSKLGTASFARVAPLHAFDSIISDQGASQEVRKWLGARGRYVCVDEAG